MHLSEIIENMYQRAFLQGFQSATPLGWKEQRAQESLCFFRMERRNIVRQRDRHTPR